MIEVTIANLTSYSVDTTGLEAVVHRTFLAHDVTEANVGVHVVDEARMRELNEQYKHHQGATDVLTFVQHDPEQPTPSFFETPETQREWGDVFLCYEVIAEEADAAGVTVQEQLEFLLEHGCLHLLGIHHD